MKEHALRKKDRVLKRRFFHAGVISSGVTLIVAATIGTILVITDLDPRPFAAILPLFYVPVMLGGVAWLGWASAAPERGDS